MKILEVNPQEYHSKLTCKRDDLFAEDSYLSKSVLWELKNRSPYQWRYYPKPFTGSKSADWGSVVDCLVTTPHLLDTVVVTHDFDSFRTKEAREFRDEQVAKGVILMKPSELEEAKKAAIQINKHRDAKAIIEGSKQQTVLFGKSNGIQLKGLADFVPTDAPILADLKTTANWSRRGLQNTTRDLAYHVQAGLYLFLWNSMFPEEPRKRFRFVWQQSEAPYEVVVTELPADDIAAGQEWAADHIEILARCAETKKWPGLLGERVTLLGRPVSSIYQDEEDREALPIAPGLK